MPMRRNKIKIRQSIPRGTSRKSKVSGASDFQKGYEAGYTHGILKGKQSYGSFFEGTSIIIPTFNQKALLLQCIESIEAHTTMPYEIIVVDNGSEDGTAEELRSRRVSIRLAVHSQNLGFARAINTGLMMAKGSTIVLLNNDTLVTEGWLSNMLRCLNDCPEIAVVGPVTNYISGEQQIDVPYEDIAGMYEFAAIYNASDERKWWNTDRLVGFCLLFARSTFEGVGYLDEGYEFGNFEDDDWIVRLRFQGKKMKIAGDTFIHHFGSVTMKGLGNEGFKKVNGQNENFFTEKWGNVYEILQRQSGQNCSEGTKSLDFFPTHIWIRGLGERVYWLEHGVKYPIDHGVLNENEKHRAIRLSVIDLLQLPTGPQRCSEEALSPTSAYEGALFRGADGCIYQLDQGKRREIVSSYAILSWGLVVGEDRDLITEGSKLPIGVPILPAPRLKSEDL